MGNAQPTLYFGKDDQPCFTPEDIAKRASLLKAEKLIGQIAHTFDFLFEGPRLTPQWHHEYIKAQQKK